VLSTLARDAIDLFTGPLAGRIRRCAGVNCTLFADTSRRHLPPRHAPLVLDAAMRQPGQGP
jgi:hypothetical protein